MTDDIGSDDAGDDSELFAETSEIVNEVQYDPTSDRCLAVVVVQAVATQAGENRDAFRKSPLHDSIDISAVETLLFGTPPNQSTGPATQSVTFRYCTVLVTIRADGVIQLAEPDDNTTEKR